MTNLAAKANDATEGRACRNPVRGEFQNSLAFCMSTSKTPSGCTCEVS
jgi:hypothetical protein